MADRGLFANVVVIYPPRKDSAGDVVLFTFRVKGGEVIKPALSSSIADAGTNRPIKPGSARVQAPDCGAPASRSDFAAGLILLSLAAGVSR